MRDDRGLAVVPYGVVSGGAARHGLRDRVRQGRVGLRRPGHRLGAVTAPVREWQGPPRSRLGPSGNAPRGRLLLLYTYKRARPSTASGNAPRADLRPSEGLN